MGYLVLEGGAEFGGRMAEVDRQAIELAGGYDAPIRILPTAAAPDHNHKRAGDHGMRWFQSLGAKDVQTVGVLDTVSANDATLSASLRTARLIYLLGGFPRHLGETLADSLCWSAALQAFQSGAVIAGSSAGAMVLCEHYFDPYEKKLLRGLNLISGACVLPHHNHSGKALAEPLGRLLPEVTLVGIDEQTGMFNDSDGVWMVAGAGVVTLYRGGQVERHARGAQFRL
jgi:cyanophycinase